MSSRIHSAVAWMSGPRASCTMEMLAKRVFGSAPRNKCLVPMPLSSALVWVVDAAQQQTPLSTVTIATHHAATTTPPPAPRGGENTNRWNKDGPLSPSVGGFEVTGKLPVLQQFGLSKCCRRPRYKANDTTCWHK